MGFFQLKILYARNASHNKRGRGNTFVILYYYYYFLKFIFASHDNRQTHKTNDDTTDELTNGTRLFFQIPIVNFQIQGSYFPPYLCPILQQVSILGISYQTTHNSEPTGTYLPTGNMSSDHRAVACSSHGHSVTDFSHTSPRFTIFFFKPHYGIRYIPTIRRNQTYRQRNDSLRKKYKYM